MAKKKQKEVQGDETPAWLVTFSDLMTLLLTFFVLLLSLASLTDERKRLVSIGSVMGSFGMGKGSVQPLTTQPGPSGKEAGAMENVPSDDLEPLRPLIWEDDGEDLDFQSNRFIQIFSIDTELMFAPGATTLTKKGRDIMRKIIPVLKRVKYPLLITGHTGSIRSEFTTGYVVGMDDKGIDLSWNVSLQRVLTVYRLLLQGGIAPEMVRMEAFGRFREKASNATPSGRRANRRVEFVLDRRGTGWSHELAQQAGTLGKVRSDKYIYNDFVFDLNGTQKK